MILFTAEDKKMLDHVIDVIGDRMHHGDGYTMQDEATVAKLDKLAKAPATAVVVTGEEFDSGAHQMFQAIVKAELANWVPDASQRLLYRAGRIVGIEQNDPSQAGSRDCGPERIQHTLISDWVAGLYLSRCVNCFRLY